MSATLIPLVRAAVVTATTAPAAPHEWVSAAAAQTTDCDFVGNRQ